MLDFQVLGSIAGIGGLALGTLVLLYRDFVRNIIREKMFRTLTGAQATALFGAVITFTFAIAILGIFATLADGAGAQRFLLLVGLVLGFLLVVLLLVGRYAAADTGSGRPSGAADERAPAKVARLVAAGEADRAERALESAGMDREAEEYWYWKARIALARGNTAVASGYVDEALALDPRNPHGIALKIRILLVGGAAPDRAQAQRLATGSEGLGSELDVWLRRLRAEGMLDGRVHTDTELDARCPLPARA
ncbi:hypothetical protein [Streptomyces sp. NRRL S-87]|uniref:hypothetical protein n=1 Tax=Streptomyces sp. NRRL S-87 TaxID=1463920 RepID=UPI001F295397|nr:hypothetical protein [Streptomyces sp. NRRL S-87]